MGVTTIEATPKIRDYFRRVFGVGTGGFLEWFDYTIYASFAVIISVQIFGSIGAIFLTFLAFGFGYVFRPLGSFVFGHIGDKYGRKRALTLTFWVMGLGTIVTGLIPPYHMIGIAAPLLMTVGRLAQGFGAGGEWGSASSYLIELGGKNRRGFFGSIQEFIALFGIVIATAVGLFLSHLPSAFLQSIGWRIPFIIGGIIVVAFIYYARREMPESYNFEDIKRKKEVKSSPILATFKNDYKPFIYILFGTAAQTTAFYALVTYMTTYMITEIHISLTIALEITFTALVTTTALTPVMGFVSDKLKTRKWMIIIPPIILIPYSLIYFMMVNTGIIPLIFLGAALFGVFLSPAGGTLIAFTSEAFPTTERTTGATSYNIASAYFGGFAPTISIFLIGALHTKLAPAYWVMAISVISIMFIALTKDTGKLEVMAEEKSLYSKTIK